MDFKKLIIWQRSKDLSIQIFLYFQNCQDYGFKDQITRSSLSIPSNIAEGMTRESNLEKVRFLNIAISSSAELTTQIIIGNEINYIDSKTKDIWLNEINNITPMIHALIAKLRTKN